MARNAPKGPTPVDSITHEDKRTNVPTADAIDFHDSPALEEVRQVRYARDESLDPQLVWRGKYPPADRLDGYDSDLVADAPPIYIQEKIDPRVLIENLRRTAERQEDEPELRLFDSFDGLDDRQQIEYYKHEANWSNRMILGDSLQVMASLADREKLRGKVQMIYIDPPYGIKFGSNWQVRVGQRDLTDGRADDFVREAEQVRAFRDTWELGIHSYLTYLRDRLLVARELLADSGSCFLQIGDENVHLVRSLMDEVFGPENFASQIVFQKTSGQEALGLANVADHILWYGKSPGLKRMQLYRPKIMGGVGAKEYRRVELADGSFRPASAHELAGRVPLPDGAQLFTTDNITSDGGVAEPLVLPSGRKLAGKAGVHWKTTNEGMSTLDMAGRIMPSGGFRIYKRYFDDFAVSGMTNLWIDTRGESDRMYVVQTSETVVERCILMCSEPGDLVLDPTCGSGTTASVAERWGRRWITVDSSRVALAIARRRIMSTRFPWWLLADTPEGYAKEQELSARALPRATFGGSLRDGFVYDRVQHITLGSIANNPDVTAGMSRAEIDRAIRRHAEFELLYDKPFQDPKKVRVAGPFTVESLSPHRALSFRDWEEPLSESEAALEAASPNFEQSILENLAKAGIQNGAKAERIKFSVLENYAGSYIQSVGEQVLAEAQAQQSRVGIAVGPQYGTVSPAFVKNAAKEAIEGGNLDLLCILGFAFDPNVANVMEIDGVTVEATDESVAEVEGARLLGKLPVLLVRMNSDLLMGEALKKTGAGNLFTVFGEPDIAIEKSDDGYVVDLKGVDIYDPTTGEVRSSDTNRIALWMIDTDYNGESFFVRHCYFTGGNDPYKRLKTALKADINEEAWESMYRTVSRPFPAPSDGNKIAVKVINDYGDEVMKVFDV